MADTMQVSISLTGAENVVIPVTQPGTSAATLPTLTGPLFSFAKTLMPATGFFSVQRVYIGPGFTTNFAYVARNVLIIPDDSAFKNNPGLQISIYDQLNTTLHGSLNGFTNGNVYSSAPTQWPALFTTIAGQSRINYTAEQYYGSGKNPVVAFSITIYSW
jgi:hypothetical protein